MTDGSDTSEPARPSALILAVAVVGCLPVVPGLDVSFWRDEAVTASVTVRSWGELFSLLPHAEGGFAGYEVLIHAWASVFGVSEVSLRMPSLLASFGTIVATGVLATRLGSRRAGPLAAAVVALHPYLVPYYGLEARGYALATFFVTLAALAAVRVWRTGAGVPAYAVATSVAVTLNFFAVLAALALLGWVLATRPTRRTAAWLLLPLTVATLMLVLTQRSSGLQTWLTAPGLDTLATIVGRTVGPGAAVAGVLLVVGAMLAWRYAVRSSVDLLDRVHRRDVVVLLGWAAGPTLLLLAVSWSVTPALLARYVLPSVVPVAVLLGVGADLVWAASASPGVHRGPRRAVRAVLVAAAVSLVAGSAWFGALRPAPKEADLRATSTYLVRHAQRGDGLLYAPSRAQAELDWYLAGDPVGAAPPDLAAAPGRSTALFGPVRSESELELRLRAVDRVWLFGYPEDDVAGPDPGDPVAAAIRRCWQLLDAQRPGGDLTLQLWQRPAGEDRGAICPA